MKTPLNLKLTHLLGSAAVMATAMMASQPALAQDELSCSNVEIIVPFSEGGGTDTWIRIIQPYLQKHLPNEPNIVIRNMPGGGAVIGANYFEQNARPDGCTLLAVSTSLTLSYVLSPDNERIRFDATEWTSVLGSPIGNMIYSTTEYGIEDFETLAAAAAEEDLRIPVSSPTGSDLRTLLSMKMLDLEVSPVFGLDGGDAHLAYERGEVHVGRDSAGGYHLMMQPLVDEGRTVPIFTFGFENEEGEIVRDPTFPDTPHFLEVYRDLHGEDPSGPEYEAWLAFFRIGIMNSKQLVLPAGTPQEIIDIYAQTMADVTADPEFLDAARAEIGDYPQLIGENAKASMSRATAIQPETREWVRAWVKEDYDTDL